MAESLTIARPYAEAAFDTAVQNNALQPWGEALSRLAMVVVQPQAAQLIGDPRLAPQQVADVIADVAQGLSAEQRNFVRVLAENERLAVLPEIAQLFDDLHNRHVGVLDAHVTSAFALTDVQVFEIRNTLEQKYGQRVQITVTVDPDLIGGVSIRIGDEVMDASVRGKLAQLASALTH